MGVIFKKMDWAKYTDKAMLIRIRQCWCWLHYWRFDRLKKKSWMMFRCSQTRATPRRLSDRCQGAGLSISERQGAFLLIIIEPLNHRITVVLSQRDKVPPTFLLLIIVFVFLNIIIIKHEITAVAVSQSVTIIYEEENYNLLCKFLLIPITKNPD